MEFFATYVYPFALILFGAAIAGPLGIFGTQRWMEHRQHQADAIPDAHRPNRSDQRVST
jgi:uncharacterized integral membrane protein